MRLERYVARVSAASTLLVLLGLVVLVVAVTLVESAGDLSGVHGAARVAAKLVAYSAVQYGYQLLPIACFLGALVAGTLLARSGELLAAQAAGISVQRLAVPFLGVVGLAALLGAIGGEFAVPWAVRGAERLQREELRSSSALSGFYNRRVQWFRERDLLLYLPAADAEAESFPGATIYRFANGQILEVIDSKALRHDERGWYVEEAQVRATGSVDLAIIPELRLALSVTPSDLIDVTGDPRQLTRWEIERLIERRVKAGFDATAHEIELSNRTALPISALWMFLLVLPWALHPERRRSLAVSLGGGVVAIAAMLSIINVFRLLALGHQVPVAVGAYGSALVALAVLPVSLFAYRRYRVRGAIF